MRLLEEKIVELNKENMDMRQYQKTKVADYIFYNGSVITVDKNDQIFEALAVKGNKIIAVGSQEGIVNMARKFEQKKTYLTLLV